MNQKDRYTFFSVFSYEDGYEIAVTFPDLPGCVSSGADEKDALKMAREALGLHLWGMEKDGEVIPEITPLNHLTLHTNECAVPVEVCMSAFRLAQKTRSVNRTVTLPA